jgi:cytochrome c oxidase subunit 2
MDQGALDPAGHEAERIAELFWWMTGGGTAIWLMAIGLTLYAVYFAREPIAARKARLLVIAAGVVFPTVVLAGLLVYGLAMLPPFLAPAPEGSLRVHVTGEQWWWRVRYTGPGGEPIDLANELRLPAGRAVELELESRDVIHSFWIPELGGKMDMIPGRRTRLLLHPTRTGTFRGVCAEYCGASHAYMAFAVRVVEEEEFSRWLAQQARPAEAPLEPVAARGRELFLGNGCGACHTVRGIAAAGRIGPDLTHVGGRDTLAAGRLANEADDLQRWITRPAELKPQVHMPGFAMLPPDDLRALAVFLESLK